MTPAPGIDPTALPPTRGPLTGGLISCALREARLKVSSTLSKVAGCRGGALARAPQSAELPCALISAGGGLRGNPHRGFPLFLYSSACAPFYWVGSLPCPAIRPHFFGACPKKRCRAAKEKRLFYPGGSTIRVSATASVVFTHLRPTWGGAGGCLNGCLRRGRTGLIMAALRSQSTSRASLSFIASACHQKRVSLGLHPVSLRKSKEMGWNGQGQRCLWPGGTAHT